MDIQSYRDSAVGDAQSYVFALYNRNKFSSWKYSDWSTRYDYTISDWTSSEQADGHIVVIKDTGFVMLSSHVESSLRVIDFTQNDPGYESHANH